MHIISCIYVFILHHEVQLCEQRVKNTNRQNKKKRKYVYGLCESTKK